MGHPEGSDDPREQGDEVRGRPGEAGRHRQEAGGGRSATGRLAEDVRGRGPPRAILRDQAGCRGAQDRDTHEDGGGHGRADPLRRSWRGPRGRTRGASVAMISSTRELDPFIERVRADVESRLSDLLRPIEAAPPKIVEALRYAVLGGGKRLRPVLVVASGEASASTEPPGEAISRRLVDAACAVELVHAFSLVHDDLPALDDDHLRRGRPTLHVRFDEATAVLAGDALLNLAFDALSRDVRRPDLALRAIAALSHAVGLAGMISGQVLDLEAEASSADADRLHRIHSLKTGALIAASCELGGILAEAPEPAIGRLGEFGRHLGLAFQIVDDILDVEGCASELGKSPGKDARAGKATFPALWGLQRSRQKAAESVEQACAALEPMGRRASPLEAIARGVLTRKT